MSTRGFLKTIPGFHKICIFLLCDYFHAPILSQFSRPPNKNFYDMDSSTSLMDSVTSSIDKDISLLVSPEKDTINGAGQNLDWMDSILNAPVPDEALLAAKEAAEAMFKSNPSASVFKSSTTAADAAIAATSVGSKRSIGEISMPSVVGIAPPVEPVAPLAPLTPLVPLPPLAPVAPLAPLTPLAPVAPLVPVEPVLKKVRKSNKCVFSGLTFGSMPVSSIQKSASMRLLQVLSGVVTPEMRKIFDSDKLMIDGFHLDLYLSMSDVMKKHILDTNEYIRIPQKCVKRVFMEDSIKGKYSKIVHYVSQNTEKNFFDDLEMNSMLGHYSKSIKNINKQFPNFEVRKIGSMKVLEFKKV